MKTKNGVPIIAERSITKTIVPILLHGGGTPAARALVAVGFIADRVAAAYGVPAPDTSPDPEPVVIRSFSGHVIARLNPSANPTHPLAAINLAKGGNQ